MVGSRLGLSIIAIMRNVAGAEAAGVDTIAWKLRAMTVSAGLAAIAGGFYAVILLVVTPGSVFGMVVSAQAIVVTIFGGAATPWGPVLGAAILVPLAEGLHAQFGDVVPGIQGVIYGVALVVIVLWMPEGLYWAVRDALVRRRSRAPSAAAAGLVATRPSVSILQAPLHPAAGPSAGTIGGEPILEVRQASVAFGGLRALQDVSFTVSRGETLGVIGPNGAGKTTLFNVLNGFVAPSAGTIRFEGKALVGLRPNRVCRLGIGRTFQVARTFARRSVRDNVIVGAYVAAATDWDARRMADVALARVGLTNLADRPVDALTSKELRLMELARALAPRPRLLLMDETLAGLGRQEIDELLGVIDELHRDGVSIVIIEHTMDALLRTADRLLVLDHGSVIAEGVPAEVVRDRRVVEAYLGQRWLDRAVG
jgi:branched-chain amino acid transport system permease protein